MNHGSVNSSNAHVWSLFFEVHSAIQWRRYLWSSGYRRNAGGWNNRLYVSETLKPCIVLVGSCRRYSCCEYRIFSYFYTPWSYSTEYCALISHSFIVKIIPHRISPPHTESSSLPVDHHLNLLARTFNQNTIQMKKSKKYMSTPSPHRKDVRMLASTIN